MTSVWKLTGDGLEFLFENKRDAIKSLRSSYSAYKYMDIKEEIDYCYAAIVKVHFSDDETKITTKEFTLKLIPVYDEPLHNLGYW